MNAGFTERPEYINAFYTAVNERNYDKALSIANDHPNSKTYICLGSYIGSSHFPEDITKIKDVLNSIKDEWAKATYSVFMHKVYESPDVEKIQKLQYLPSIIPEIKNEEMKKLFLEHQKNFLAGEKQTSSLPQRKMEM